MGETIQSMLIANVKAFEGQRQQILKHAKALPKMAIVCG